MQEFKTDFVKIWQTERGVIALMALNLIFSAVLFIFAMLNLNPEASVVKIGYSDLGGYRDGAWLDLVAFPIFAVIFGLFHNLLSVRIFHKRGSGMAKFFLFTTAFMIFGAILVLIRLLGEG